MISENSLGDVLRGLAVGYLPWGIFRLVFALQAVILHPLSCIVKI